MKNILKKSVGLRAKLVVSFSAAICIVIATAFISISHVETSLNELKIDKIARASDDDEVEFRTQYQLHTVLNRLKLQIAITAFVLALVLAGVGWYADRLFVQRIKRTLTITDNISQGQFNQTVPETINDEIGLLGQKINDMAMNTQECLMYMWNMSNRMADSLKHGLEKGQSVRPALLHMDVEHVEKMNEAIAEMHNTVRSFGLFGVVINDEKLMAVEHVDREQENPKQQDHTLDGSFPLQRKVGSFPG